MRVLHFCRSLMLLLGANILFAQTDEYPRTGPVQELWYGKTKVVHTGKTRMNVFCEPTQDKIHTTSTGHVSKSPSRQNLVIKNEPNILQMPPLEFYFMEEQEIGKREE